MAIAAFFDKRGLTDPARWEVENILAWRKNLVKPLFRNTFDITPWDSMTAP
jgi:hypothetical protein